MHLVVLAHQHRDDVPAEFIGVACLVLPERVEKHVRPEAEHGERGPVALRLGRLLLVGEHAAALFAVFGDLRHAEAGGGLPGDLDEGGSDVGVLLGVVADHFAVIHLIDVVTGEDEDHRGAVVTDVVEVLIDGVGRAPVPVRVFVVLERRQDGDAAIAADHVPGGAGADVIDQGVGAVLAEDGDAFDAGVEEVGEGEVDHPGKTAEGNSGFGPVVGENAQLVDAATSEDHCQSGGSVHRATVQRGFQSPNGKDLLAAGR